MRLHGARIAWPLVGLLAGTCGDGGALRQVGDGSLGHKDASAPGDGVADGGIGLPDAAAAADAPPRACAEETHAARRVPLDVFLLLDASNSMNEPAGSRTKHQVVRTALRSFLADPLSAGIGVGLSFFPAVTTCQFHEECPADGNLPGRCALAPDTSCVAANGIIGVACDAEMKCPAGEGCRQIGQCPSSLGPDQASPRCGLGTMCPDGAACQPTRYVCRTPGADCSGSHYAKPAVAFAGLPAALPGLTTALDARAPAGGTPLPEAVTGTLGLLRAQLDTHPDHEAVLVVASDGLPDATCGGAPGVVAAITSATSATPSIATYAIGVFSGATAATGRAFMSDVAKAGGTNAPYVLEADAGLGASFLAALNAIRGVALPCAYVIPSADQGTIDYGKVNVRARAAGRDELIGYVDGADKCTPGKGGWHYDVDPKAGATPKRVSLCPSTCQAWKALPSAEVEIRFGCKTISIE
jgi:hypothetical protein